jgi:hypothetical protein
MVRFSKGTLVGGKLKETEVRVVRYSDIGKCPHLIMSPTHFRDDGSCKCNDPNEKVMQEWGYRWRNGKWR